MRRFLLNLGLGVILATAIVSEGAAQTRTTPTVVTDVPRTLSYQGALQTGDGKPIADGAYIVTARFYTDAAGSKQIWEGQYTTTIHNGILNLTLGGDGGTPLPSSEVMGSQIWTGIQIGQSAEMRPLTPLSATAYALNVANASITKDKMATDYIASVSVNGHKLTGTGSDLKIVAGPGLNMDVDPSKNEVVLSSTVDLGRTKGGKIDANTVITGTLAVYNATSFNTAGGSTTIGSNANSNPGVLSLAQGTPSGRTASILAPSAAMSANQSYYLPVTGGTLMTSDNLNANVIPATANTVDLGSPTVPFRNVYADPITIVATGNVNYWELSPDVAGSPSGRMSFGYNATTAGSYAEKMYLSPAGDLHVSGQVQIQGTGSGSTTFQGGAQGTAIHYTLPTAYPTSNGQVLACTTGGTLSWVNPSSFNVGHAISASTANTAVTANSATSAGHAAAASNANVSIHAAHASNANQSAHSDNAAYASFSGAAQSAGHAAYSSGANTAVYASYAGSANEANYSTNAAHATYADNATYANYAGYAYSYSAHEGGGGAPTSAYATGSTTQQSTSCGTYPIVNTLASAETFDFKVKAPEVSPTSVIIVTAMLNRNSRSADYMATVVAIQNGEFTVRLRRGDRSPITKGEGLTLQYMVLNTPNSGAKQ